MRMIDQEKVITALEQVKDEINPVSGSRKARLRDAVDDAIALLKEQEAKTGHWIFESRYCDAWSNICSECGRLMTTGAGVYANYCSNCGAKMTGGEEK